MGELESGLRLLGARAFEKGGQVLGVDRVVSKPRGRIGEWAQAAWCEGVSEGETSAWGLGYGLWGG